MGLIKAITSAASGVLSDQWKEFFYCEALDKSVLVAKGVKKTKGNNNGNDNIISNGSGVAVADGQCMIIVDQGKVVEICAEPGEFTYDASTEPSVFSGNLGTAILDSFKSFGKRLSYGGDTGKDQRVYYFNTKEIIDNKFGTPSPVPFRVVDSRVNLDIDVSLRCSGVYSYKITDPLLFYTNVCGNVDREYRRDEIDNQLKQEFIAALQPALARLSAMEMRPNQIPAHNVELANAMKEVLSSQWSETRGITVCSVALGSVTLPDEDANIIKEAQKDGMNLNTQMAGARLVGAQVDAMRAAASNPNGAMNGFMGMNMAAAAGGMNAAQLFAMGGNAQPAQASAPAQGWTCSCGSVNQGKFCANCGSPKPAGAPLYKCDKCGWMPADPTNPPKFCPQCGDPFTDADVQ